MYVGHLIVGVPYLSLTQALTNVLDGSYEMGNGTSTNNESNIYHIISYQIISDRKISRYNIGISLFCYGGSMYRISETWSHSNL